MNEEAERRRKLIAEAKRARSNFISVKTATPVTLTTGDRGDEKYCLNVDKWRDIAIWKDYEIPYLFLGYEPMSCEFDKLYRIEDSTYLNDIEADLYRNYLRLITEAIKLDLLTSFEITSHSISLRAVDVIKWRDEEKKDSIKPEPIYLKLEKAISESSSNANNNEQQDQEEQTDYSELEKRDKAIQDEADKIIRNLIKHEEPHDLKTVANKIFAMKKYHNARSDSKLLSQGRIERIIKIK